MNANRLNAEGYYDPTCYEAMTHIETEQRKTRFRPLVSICSPYSGDVERNTENARRYCRFAVESGNVPIAPHLFFPQFMSDEKTEERELALFMSLIILTKCNELWVFGEAVSEGMAREIRKANARGMTIRYFTTDCKEVTKP